MASRIGILGGTFDPIHYGHLAVAEDVRVACALDRVLLIPAAQQPLKRGRHVATPEQRLSMARLACAGNEAFAVSSIEVERDGPSYSVLTLEELSSTKPGELFFIMGADALADLPRWRDVPRILELARIVAVARPGVDLDIDAARRSLPALEERLTLVEGPRIDISSTELRARVAAGRPIRYLTPDPVVEYIREQRLYLRDL